MDQPIDALRPGELMTQDENAGVVAWAVDAQHRATGCFHALLSVLHAPLAVFVAANGPTILGGESAQRDQVSRGLRTHLQHVRDHWATASEATGVRVEESRVADVNAVLRVLAKAFDGGDADFGSYDDGCAAVLRLLEAVGASETALRQAHALTVMLNWRAEGGKASVSDEDADSSTAEAEVSQLSVGGFPQSDDESSGPSDSDSSDDDSNLSAILDEALSESAAHAGESDESGHCYVGVQRAVEVGSMATESSSLVKKATEDTTAAAASLVEEQTGTSQHPSSNSIAVSDSPAERAQTSVCSNASKQLRSCVDKRDFGTAVFWVNEELKSKKAGSAEYAKLLVMRARCRFELQQYIHVYNDSQSALAIDKSLLEAYQWATRALVELDRLSEAHSMCHAGLNVNASDTALKALEREISRMSSVASAAKKKATSVSGSSVSGSENGSTTASVASSAMASKQVPQATDAGKLLANSIANGLKLLETGYFLAADVSFTQALKLLAPNAVSERRKVLGHRARCLLGLKRYTEARDDALEALKLKANWAEGHRLCCKALMGLERWQEALGECEAVLREAPQDTIFRQLKQSITAKIAARQPTTSTATVHAESSWKAPAKALVQTGLALVEKNKYVEAEASFSKALVMLQALKNSSTDAAIVNARVKALGHRARCRLATKSYANAGLDARTAITLQADWTEGYRLLCHSLMGRQEWSQALTACKRVLKHTPADAEFRKHKELIEEKLKPQAAPAHSPAPAPITTNEAAKSTVAQLVDRGLELMVSGQYRAAESKFSTAIALLGSTRAKESASFFCARARCRIEIKKCDEALDDAHESLKCYPGWIRGFHVLCLAHMSLRQWREASQVCERVLAQHPHLTTFQIMKTNSDRAIQRSKVVDPFQEKTDATIAPIKETKEPHAKEEAPASTAPSSKGLVSDGIREVERFAVHGSIVAQRFVFAQNCLQNARSHTYNGNIEMALDGCRRALKKWPQLDIPRDIAVRLRSVDSRNAIEYGGVMLYIHLEAAGTDFTSSLAERDFWRQRVERYPHSAQLRTKLALVLYQRGEIDAALEHAEEALKEVREDDLGTPGLDSTSSAQYLRAVCSPIEVESSPLTWLANVFSNQPEPRTRGSELLKYIQRNTVDDEWMPHACYSLGLLHLHKREYVQATQYYFLANEAEIRRAKLRLFPEINDLEFPDKKLLQDAVTGDKAVLSLSQQYDAVNRPMKCTWCNESVTVNTFFEHKLEECAARPKLQIPINVQ